MRKSKKKQTKNSGTSEQEIRDTDAQDVPLYVGFYSFPLQFISFTHFEQSRHLQWHTINSLFLWVRFWLDLR